MHTPLPVAGLAALAVSTAAFAQPGCLPDKAGASESAAPVCDGYYDVDGVWRHGGGHYDADGNWRSDSGRYNSDGEWVAAKPATTSSSALTAAAAFGVVSAFVSGPAGVRDRESWLAGLIRKGRAEGALSRIDVAGDLGRLVSIRSLQARYAVRHDGLTDQDQSDIAAQLDDLTAAITAQWRPSSN